MKHIKNTVIHKSNTELERTPAMADSYTELFLSIDDAVRLEQALADFDRLTDGTPPDRHQLAAAPLLSDWRRTQMPAVEPALTGLVSDHPHLQGSRQIVTSRLLILDETAGWARTLSRLYRLSSMSR